MCEMLILKTMATYNTLIETEFLDSNKTSFPRDRLRTSGSQAYISGNALMPMLQLLHIEYTMEQKRHK